MSFNEIALLAIDLLPEFRCDLFGVDFFDISGAPAAASPDLIPVSSTTARQLHPMAKLPLMETALLLIHCESAFLQTPHSGIQVATQL